MTERWVISDTHFGHGRILTFTGSDGNLVRQFASVEEMDETIVDNWNKVVKPEDIVYHLGDVVLGTGDNANYLSILYRCNGVKELIKGNHDLLDDSIYLKHFQRVHTMKIFQKKKGKPGMIMTHIPVHLDCVERFNLCLHGHIHNSKINDKRYINCCVDFPGNNYTPLNIDEICKWPSRY